MNDIPYMAHESMLARQERTIRRLFIIIIFLIILLVGTNGAWIWYESQFVDISTSVEADSDDGTAIANISGEVQYYGESKSDS